MITHFLGPEEVDGYSRDIAQRLEHLGEKSPTVWCAIGQSGLVLAERIGRFLKTDPILVVQACFNKSTERVSIDPKDEPLLRNAHNVLVLDSSIHSGASMLAVVRHLHGVTQANLLTYALVIRAGANFIPHFFGLIVAEHDRTLFMLETIPNNRLFNVAPIGVLRTICEDDCQRESEALDTGVPSLDKITWGDLWYEKRAHGLNTYIIEIRGDIAAYIQLKLVPEQRLMINVVAADKRFHGAGLGGALLRWAETLARSAKCHSLDLWAIEDKVPMYQHLGYAQTGEKLDLGKGERYERMTRELLYTFDLQQLQHG